MLNLKVEDAAEEVLRALRSKGPPVDVIQLARDEGILLAPSTGYGPEFHGRLEYRASRQKFLLFYPTQVDGTLTRRQRFNFSHELGHYYLEPHRDALLQGSVHNSTPGFVCQESFEREADDFAAALMIPRRFMESKLARRDFLELKGVLAMADECQTSGQCAAIRYATFTGECCCVFLTRNGKIIYNIVSDEARSCGFSYVERLPETSASEQALADPRIIKGHAWRASDWFGEKRSDPKVFEEAVGLGYGDYVLTLLSLEIDREE